MDVSGTALPDLEVVFKMKVIVTRRGIWHMVEEHTLQNQLTNKENKDVMKNGIRIFSNQKEVVFITMRTAISY